MDITITQRYSYILGNERYIKNIEPVTLSGKRAANSFIRRHIAKVLEKYLIHFGIERFKIGKIKWEIKTKKRSQKIYKLGDLIW